MELIELNLTVGRAEKEKVYRNTRERERDSQLANKQWGQVIDAENSPEEEWTSHDSVVGSGWRMDPT